MKRGDEEGGRKGEWVGRKKKGEVGKGTGKG